MHVSFFEKAGAAKIRFKGFGWMYPSLRRRELIRSGPEALDACILL